MWKKLLILSAFYNNINVVKGQIKPFIFGGQEVTDNTYKFIIYVNYEMNGGIKTCTASLIHEKWVLTSAHCFEVSPHPEKVLLVAGQPKIPTDLENLNTNLQKRKALKIYVNEQYDFEDEAKFDSDIALIEVDMAFQLNENVSCIEYFKGMFD